MLFRSLLLIPPSVPAKHFAGTLTTGTEELAVTQKPSVLPYCPLNGPKPHGDHPQVLTPVISLLCTLCSGETMCSLPSDSLLNHGLHRYCQPGWPSSPLLDEDWVQSSPLRQDWTHKTLPGGAPAREGQRCGSRESFQTEVQA